MDKDVLDLYTDYLMSLFGQTTATGLSTLLDGTLSHDRISRFLAAEEFNSVTLWQFVKPLVRQVQQEDAVVHSLPDVKATSPPAWASWVSRSWM